MPSSASTSKATSRRAPRGRVLAAAQSKAGEAVDARIINTSSGAGLMGSVGQGTYSAAKAGIAALTLVEAAEMAPLRRHRQRDRAGGAHPHDRRGVRRPHGRPRGRVRRRTTPATCRRSSSGSAARTRATSPAASSRSRAARSPSPTAGSTARRSTRARAGIRPTIGAAVRDLLAKAPPPGAGLRRAVAVRARRPRPMRAAPPELRNRWRASGAWTDETLLDRFGSADPNRLAIVDGDLRVTVGDLDRVGACTQPVSGTSASDPATSSPGSCRTGGKPSRSVGGLALRRGRESDHADARPARGRIRAAPDRRARRRGPAHVPRH